MSRRSFQEYFDSRPQRPVRVTRAAVVTMMAKAVKRKLIADGRIPAEKPKKKFMYDLIGLTGGTVYAHTRGEARALVKKDLGISRSGRLPKGMSIIEVSGANQPAMS